MFLRFVILFLLMFSLPAFATRIVFLGDSLTDGYGVARDKAYPALIEKKLKANGHPDVQIVNSSVSGSTTASALGRLKWILKDKPKILVLALGANDGLRGLKIPEAKKNLAETIQLAKDNGIHVVLVGMKIPPNYGVQYSADFEKMFSDLAKKYQLPLIPFLLEGVGAESALNQGDGIHPNEKGQAKVAETVYPHILKAMQNVR